MTDAAVRLDAVRAAGFRHTVITPATYDPDVEDLCYRVVETAPGFKAWCFLDEEEKDEFKRAYVKASRYGVDKL